MYSRLPKDSITYGGSVNVNHDTATFGTENFVTNTSSISGDLLMEMPFLFHGNWAWASTIHWPQIKIIPSALPEKDRYGICRTTYCKQRAHFH